MFDYEEVNLKNLKITSWKLPRMIVSSNLWQWARYMTMKVATRSSGTPPLIPPGGKHRSRRLGNSGKRVASATAVAAEAAATAEAGEPADDEEEVRDRDAEGIPPPFPEQDEGI